MRNFYLKTLGVLGILTSSLLWSLPIKSQAGYVAVINDTTFGPPLAEGTFNEQNLTPNAWNYLGSFPRQTTGSYGFTIATLDSPYLTLLLPEDIQTTVLSTSFLISIYPRPVTPDPGDLPDPSYDWFLSNPVSFDFGAFGNLGIGDPVMVTTGEFYIDAVDLTLAGPMPLEIRRNYASRNERFGSFGVGWKFGYNHFLDPRESGDLLYGSTFDGTVIAYRKVVASSPERWEPLPGDNPGLKAFGGGEVPGISQNPFHGYIEKTEVSGDVFYTLYQPDGFIGRFEERSYPHDKEGVTYERTRPYLYEWSDPVGNKLEFSIEETATDPAYAQIKEIEASNGNEITITYHSDMRIKEIATSGNGAVRKVKYEYNDYGDLEEVTLPDNRKIIYDYKIVGFGLNAYSTHLLTEVEETGGKKLVNHYDPLYDPGDETYSDAKFRRVVRQDSTVGPSGQLRKIAEYEFNPSFDTWVTNGYDVTYVHSDSHSQHGRVTTTYVHKDGLLHYVADDLASGFSRFNTNIDHVITYEWYDGTETNGAVRSLKRLRDKRGLETLYEYEDDLVRKVSLKGDIDGDGITETVPTYYFYGNTLRLLRKIVHPAHKTGARRTVEFREYPTVPGGPGASRPGAQAGERYYALKPSKISEFLVPSPSLNTSQPPAAYLISEVELGHTMESFGSEEAHGMPARQTLYSQKEFTDIGETLWSYDSRGFPDDRTNRTLTTAPDLVTDFEYNDRGELERESDPAGRTTRFEYDEMGRVRFIKRFASPTAGLPLSVVEREYGADGLLETEDGPRTGSTDEVNYTYDDAGRLRSIIAERSGATVTGSGVQASGQSETEHTYDDFGNRLTTEDPLDHITKREFDKLGRLEEITYAFGTLDVASESYTYEPGGKVETHTNLLGGDTTTLYTDDGKPRKKTLPDGRILEWTYYLDGRLHTEKLSNDAVRSYVYDDQNLTETRTLQKSGTTLAKTILNYDVRGNVERREEFASASRSYVVESEYDGLGRIIRREGPPSENHPGDNSPVSARQETVYAYEYQTSPATDHRYRVTATTGDVRSVRDYDVLDRLIREAVLDDFTGGVVSETGRDYDSGFEWVEDFAVVGLTRINVVRTYTDTFGQSVLAKFADNTFTRTVYDDAGNVVSRIDELGLETAFVYDDRNRLATRTLPDNSVTSFDYDDAGNLTTRAMPGNLRWESNYDDAGRMEWEQLKGSGGVVSRRIDYDYYSSGDSLGYLEKLTENPGHPDQVTHTYQYDDNLRINRIDSSGSTVVDVRQITEYDWLGLSLSVTRASPTEPEILPSVRTTRDFDGYGQLFDEKTLRGAGSGIVFSPHRVHSHLVQQWDSAGRRISLRMGEDISPKGSWVPVQQFGHDAAGRLTSLDPDTPSATWTIEYDYDTAGYLEDSRFEIQTGGPTPLYNARRTEIPVLSRDLRGRIAEREVYASIGGTETLTLDENISARSADGLVETYAFAHGDGTGGDWATHAETRAYAYDSLSRRLATETYVPDPENPATPETLGYTFDPDDLGVRVKAENTTESVILHEADPANGGLDAFFRLADEDRFSEFHDFLASGDNTGPGHFWLWLGEGATPAEWDLVDRIYPDPDLGDGNWQAPLALKDESYSLKATAEHLHPDSTFAPEDTVSFTVAAGGDDRTISNTYDSTGRLVARSWAGGEVAQALTWDATGKLLRVTQNDSRTNPEEENFVWTAVYDPSGRRIETTYVPDNAPLAGAEAARAIRSWYDPQVEFLEIAVETGGLRWWKFHGPDLDGGYGQFQGVGGLEAIVDEATGEVIPVIDDLFGTIVARIDLGDLADPADDEVIWTEVQTSGYGPMPGSRMRPLEKIRDLPAVLAWQGRRVDPTGLFHMGARYYDPESGSFLSADPLGHSETPDLYSYANGDPINFIDPTGRGRVSGDPVIRVNPNGHVIDVEGYRRDVQKLQEIAHERIEAYFAAERYRKRAIEAEIGVHASRIVRDAAAVYVVSNVIGYGVAFKSARIAKSARELINTTRTFASIGRAASLATNAQRTANYLKISSGATFGIGVSLIKAESLSATPQILATGMVDTVAGVPVVGFSVEISGTVMDHIRSSGYSEEEASIVVDSILQSVDRTHDRLIQRYGLDLARNLAPFRSPIQNTSCPGWACVSSRYQGEQILNLSLSRLVFSRH